MKRAGNLFDCIVDRENLRLAVHRSLRGKRHRMDAREFVARLDANLRDMRQWLLAGTFPLGHFHQFVIHDPKQRIVTAPCFRERVLHHAVINVCEPVFERWLIDDTFACRRGRGRIVALHRAQQFARRFPFFLKLDIRKYFDSVPHAELLLRLERLFKDPSLLALFTGIVKSFRRSVGCGLPIGSLTSQHFANFYLGWCDRFAKEHWAMKGYVRYMDDMLVWSDSKAELRRFLASVSDYLSQKLRLDVKDAPYLNRSSQGVEFLGCRIFPWGLTLNRRSRVRFRRKLRQLEHEHLDGALSERELQQRATSLTAFTQAAGVASWKFRQQVLQQLPVSGHKARTG